MTFPIIRSRQCRPVDGATHSDPPLPEGIPDLRTIRWAPTLAGFITSSASLLPANARSTPGPRGPHFPCCGGAAVGIDLPAAVPSTHGYGQLRDVFRRQTHAIDVGCNEFGDRIAGDVLFWDAVSTLEFGSKEIVKYLGDICPGLTTKLETMGQNDPFPRSCVTMGIV